MPSVLPCRYTTAIVSPSRAPQHLLNSGPRRTDDHKADAEQKLVWPSLPFLIPLLLLFKIPAQLGLAGPDAVVAVNE